MNPTPDQIRTIRHLFNTMNGKEDFLNLLNFAKKILYKEKAVALSLKQLNYYISKDSDSFKSKKPVYHTFEINKKSGSKRLIHAPVKGLKEIQKALNIILQNVYEPHYSATGFIQGKSIVDNAEHHISKLFVYNIDLKDFFPSVDAKRVWGRLTAKPFNLGTTDERKKIANMIKTLCCHKMPVERLINDEWIKVEASVLPQGAATSPLLTNAICERLDIKLNGLAKRFGLAYSRYADDITFSSNHNSYKLNSGETETLFKKDSLFENELRKIITSQNFHIKESKVRLQKRGFRQEVTGLIVNEKTNVSRRYTRDLRHWLYFIERYGHDKANLLFLKKYIADKGHVKKGKADMNMVIEGKLLYLKMVKGFEDPSYIKLKNRFDSISNAALKKTKLPETTLNYNYLPPTFKTEKKEYEIQTILDLIFAQGLDEAMQFYNR